MNVLLICRCRLAIIVARRVVENRRDRLRQEDKASCFLSALLRYLFWHSHGTGWMYYCMRRSPFAARVQSFYNFHQSAARRTNANGGLIVEPDEIGKRLTQANGRDMR